MQTAMKPEVQEPVIDIDKFAHTPLKCSPYDYIVVPQFVRADAFARIIVDYPRIRKRGSFPLSALDWGPAFAQLLEELKGDAFRDAVARKFNVDLTGKPTMVTVRGMCGTKDGYIHTDSESKILSLLLYLNQDWEENDGGRLRILRSKNMEDVAEEIPPALGTLLIFRRSDRSWHGHKKFIGVRRVVQLNWVTEQKFVDTNYQRHGFSALLKKLNPFGEEY